MVLEELGYLVVAGENGTHPVEHNEATPRLHVHLGVLEADH